MRYSGPWQAVIFDLDDTLYPERAYVLSGFRAVAEWAEAELGIPAAQGLAELGALFAQGVRGSTFDQWLRARAHDPAPLVTRLVEVYRAHTPAIAPFDGVPALLDALRARCRVGLLSDGYLDVQRRKLAALGVAERFDAVVFSDAWGRDAWKPSAVPFAAALAALGVPASAAVYVGDNPRKDFLGARRAGMRSIRARWPDGEYAALEPESAEHAPDLTAATLAELSALLLPPEPCAGATIRASATQPAPHEERGT